MHTYRCKRSSSILTAAVNDVCCEVTARSARGTSDRMSSLRWKPEGPLLFGMWQFAIVVNRRYQIVSEKQSNFLYYCVSCVLGHLGLHSQKFFFLKKNWLR